MSRAATSPSRERAPPLPRATQVDARLAELAARDAPLRRALARIAARLVATRAWERLGFARLRDYAVERLGLSARQVHDLAHADAVLGRLPRIEAAFLAGRVGWTKLRLLGRVACPEDESLWLAAAQRLGTEALAREVRALDARARAPVPGRPDPGPPDPVLPDDLAEDEEPRETVFVSCAPATRGRWGTARLLAQRMAGEKLPPHACAEAVAAEVLSAIGLDAACDPVAEAAVPRTPVSGEPASLRPPRPPAPPHPPATDPPPARSRFLAALVRDLESADAFELDARLRRAMRLARRHEAQLGPSLLALAGERLFLDLGFRCFDAYARERLGLAPSKARALLRLERIALASAPFRAAWRRGGLSWTRAQVLAPLLVLEGSSPWHEAWIERARRVSVRRLEDDVELATTSGALDPGVLPSLPAGLSIGARPRGSGASTRIFFLAPRSVALLFRAVLATQQRRIERATGRASSESEAFHAMLEHATASWLAYRSRRSRYAIFERDGWRCTVPGCTSRRNLQDHHIVFRAAGGSNDLANRTTLCAWHHLRALHTGRIRCTGRAPGALRWELGVRAGRDPLLVYASGDRLTPADRRPAP